MQSPQRPASVVGDAFMDALKAWSDPQIQLGSSVIKPAFQSFGIYSS